MCAERAPGATPRSSAPSGRRRCRAEQRITLHVLDNAWAEHLAFIDEVREGIHLQRYGGREPISEFHRQIVACLRADDRARAGRTVEILRQLTVRDGAIDLAAAGLAGSTSTWTYLVNDNPFSTSAFADGQPQHRRRRRRRLYRDDVSADHDDCVGDDVRAAMDGKAKGPMMRGRGGVFSRNCLIDPPDGEFQPIPDSCSRSEAKNRETLDEPGIQISRMAPQNGHSTGLARFPLYRRGVAGGRASKDTDTPVVKKNVALLTSCFDIVRPTTPKMARLGDSESPAPPLTSIRNRAKPSAALRSSCSRDTTR